jgi:hypothetical protein
MRKKRSKRRRCKQAAILSLASTPGFSPEKGAGPEPSDKGSAPDEGAAGTDAPAGGEAHGETATLAAQRSRLPPTPGPTPAKRPKGSDRFWKSW